MVIIKLRPLGAVLGVETGMGEGIASASFFNGQQQICICCYYQ